MKRNLVTLAGLTGAALLSTSAFVMADHPMTAVSEKEFDRMYMEMDTNKDGRVSRAEYAHYHGTPLRYLGYGPHRHDARPDQSKNVRT